MHLVIRSIEKYIYEIVYGALIKGIIKLLFWYWDILRFEICEW